MKKRLLITLSAVCITVLSIAQAVLPTSWNFATTTLPTGWVSSGAGFTYYSGSGNPAPAAKFVYTNDMLTINFASTPGNLTYDLTGNSFSGGTFLVQESSNGTSWTTLHTFTSPPAGTYTAFADVPNSASRYIRFNYSNKVTGNIGLDNVSITAGVSTAQEISVKQGSTTIVNGGTYSINSPVSTLLPITFTVLNSGTVSTLNVSAATITGAAAADFSVATATPFSVAASSNTSLVVNFTPSAAGTRNAILTITNDDAVNNPYIINLNGIGGTLATEPTAQATNMTFPITKSFHIKGQYAAASPAPDGYLLLRKTGSAITDVPVDGTVYQRGDMIGTSKVVYSSTATGFFPNDIKANTQYYFAVFSYNGTGVYRNYLTTAPLMGNVTTSGSMQSAGYYSTINTTATSFVTDLHALTNPHSIQFYSSYGPLMAASALYSRDTTGNQRVITCVYSGLNKVYSEPFDWTTNDFSREHTYCQSWQPTVNDANFQSLPEYNDYHMITPTNQNSVNALRSNYPMGVVVGTPTYTFAGCKMGNDANGHKVFEPRDVDKGDAARCMLYECIAYTGVANTSPAGTPGCTHGASWSLPLTISNSITYGQDQTVLKQWNTQDPPDNFEIARNDYVDSLQGNRNPFIDHPEYVCLIDFTTMTATACNSGINENKNEDLIDIYPNPNNGNFMLNYTSATNQKVSLKLYDRIGRIVYSNELKVSNGINPIEMNIQNLNSGIYLFEFINEQGKQTQKFIIE